MNTSVVQVALVCLACQLPFANLSAQASEPFPLEHCTVQEGTSPKGLGVVLAYGLLLGERTREDTMTHEEFMGAMTELQDVTRLMMVDHNADAACERIVEIEQAYNLTRPDLDSLPQDSLE